MKLIKTLGLVCVLAIVTVLNFSNMNVLSSNTVSLASLISMPQAQAESDFGDDIWGFNATWFNVNITWDEDQGDWTGTSHTTGFSIYDYEQTDFDTQTGSNGMVNFGTTGTLDMDFGIGNFSINVTFDTEITGWFDPSTGEGEITSYNSGF